MLGNVHVCAKIFPLLPRVFPPNEVNFSVLRVKFKILALMIFFKEAIHFPDMRSRRNILNFIKASNEEILIKEFCMRKDDFWQLWQFDIWVFSHDDLFALFLSHWAFSVFHIILHLDDVLTFLSLFQGRVRHKLLHLGDVPILLFLRGLYMILAQKRSFRW